MLIARALGRPLLPMMVSRGYRAAACPWRIPLTAEEDLGLRPVPLVVPPAQRQEAHSHRVGAGPGW